MFKLLKTESDYTENKKQQQYWYWFYDFLAS